jgi:hypothetical protein
VPDALCQPARPPASTLPPAHPESPNMTWTEKTSEILLATGYGEWV